MQWLFDCFEDTDLQQPEEEGGDRYGRYAYEMSWVAIQPFLASRGYTLRPRYCENWVPSWVQRGWTYNRARWCQLEDTRIPRVARIMDAIAPSGSKVILKRVAKGCQEEKITLFLNSLKREPTNNLIPLLDTVDLPTTNHVLLVTPMFRTMHAGPVFHCCEEVIDFIRQMIDGLVFLHSHNLAHTDICFWNMVMDSTYVVPSGFRFQQPESQDTCDYKRIEIRKRCRVKVPVRYYIIDFATVHHYPKGVAHARRTGIKAQYRDAPELSDTVSFNPFGVDVHQLGRAFKQCLQGYYGLDDVRPFFDKLMEPVVSERPTAIDAQAMFHELSNSLDSDRRKQLVWVDEWGPFGRQRHYEESQPSAITRALVRRYPGLSGIL